jgi:3-oxoacyl-[acyl-carrier-protein] synthase II
MKRVVITGMGAVTPLGTGVDVLFAAFREGRCGLSPLEGIPVARGKGLAAQVKDSAFGTPGRLLGMVSRAVDEALRQSALDPVGRIGLFVATVAGETKELEDQYGPFMRGRPGSRLTPAILRFANGSLADAIAARFRIAGPRDVNTNACASGTVAIGRALTAIRLGQIETAIVCGCEQLKATMYWGAERAGLMGRDLRPFHRDREGTIFGEGAAALVLEESGSAFARGATPLAEVGGWGVACDDNPHFILPQLDGSANARAIGLALRDAAVAPAKIGYFNAHGTGTINIDRTEVKACRLVFGDRAAQVPVSATKSFTGHMSAASPLIEAMACVLALKDGFIHPTLKLDEVDPEFDLDLVRGTGKTARVEAAVSNSMGGGGSNAAVVLLRADSPFPRAPRSSDDDDDIIITGSAALTPYGLGVGAMFDHLDGPDPSMASHAAIGWLNIDEIVRPEATLRHLNRCGQLVAAAAHLAAQDAALRLEPYDPTRVAVIFGTMFGGTTSWSALLCEAFERDPRHITPIMALEHGHHLGVTLAARGLDAKGPNCTLTGGPLAGTQAIAFGFDLLRLGMCDAVVAGGVDIVDPPMVRALGLIGSAGRPRGRLALRLVEACACVVLERRSTISRPSALRARLVGHGEHAVPVGVLGVDHRAESLATALRGATKDLADDATFDLIHATADRKLAAVAAGFMARALAGRTLSSIDFGTRLGESFAAGGPLGLALAVDRLREAARAGAPGASPAPMLVTQMVRGGNAAVLAVEGAE